MQHFMTKGFCVFSLCLVSVLVCSRAASNSSVNPSNQYSSKLEELKLMEPNEIVDRGEKIVKKFSVSEPGENLNFRVDVLNLLSHAYILIGDYSMSLNKAKEAIQVAKANNYSFGEGVATKNVAHFYLFLSDYEIALDYYLQALELVRQYNSIEVIRIRNSIAQIYYKIGNVDESILLFEESLRDLNKTDDKRNKAYTYGGLAEAYNINGDFKQSLLYAKHSLELLQEINDKTGIIIGYRLLGELQLERQDLGRAKKHLQYSLELAIENKIYGLVLGPYNALAKVLLLERKFTMAEKTALEALKLAQDRKELSSQGESFNILSQIAETQGKPEVALEYFKQYKKVEDKLFSEQSDRNMSTLRASFEVDKLNRKNQLLKQQNEIVKVNIEKQKAQNNLLIVFFLLALSILSFIYYRFTQAKKLHHERLENEQLRSVNDMKDQILMNTSHEFRTPLAGIIGLADCLRDGLMGTQSEEAKKSLVLITNSGKRLTGLVDDIINFAQLKNGICVLNHGAVDVYQALKEVTTTCSSLLSEKDMTISNTLSPGEFIAFADEQRLIQILFNLIGNAIKYSHEGEVKITAEQNDFRITIQISDQGIGIPENKLTSIFEYFEQVDATASRAHQGSGLGLAIVKSLVELQGGSISAKSKLGEGSVFTFTLPRVVEQGITS